MVKLRIGKKVEWKDIAIGEIFACDVCWIIGEKKSKRDSYRLLAVDGNWLLHSIGDIRTFNEIEFLDFYKLPIEIQGLWRTD